jgi:hypothetical protein
MEKAALSGGLFSASNRFGDMLAAVVPKRTKTRIHFEGGNPRRVEQRLALANRRAQAMRIEEACRASLMPLTVSFRKSCVAFRQVGLVETAGGFLVGLASKGHGGRSWLAFDSHGPRGHN